MFSMNQRATIWLELFFVSTILLILAVVPVSLAADGYGEEQSGTEADHDESLGDDSLDDEFALLEEEATVYGPAKHVQPISDSPSAVTVITRREIENTHCMSFACLLRQVPELQVSRLRPMNHVLNSRGIITAMNDKVQVLVDGREINVEAFGMPFWAALPVSLDDIERIEVIRGPGSALYGANAHSLVVSIITRRQDDGADVFIAAGEHNRSEMHLRAGKKLGHWRLDLLAGREGQDAWVDTEPFMSEVYRARLVVENENTLGTSTVNLGFVHADGDFYNQLAPMFLRNTWLAHAMVTHKTSWLRAHVWFSLFKTDAMFDLPLQMKINDSYMTLGTFPESLDMFSTNLDGEVQVNYSPFEGNRILGGINYRWLTYISEHNDPDKVYQHRVGLFLQDEQRLWEQLFITAGFRLDYNSITPLTFSPRLAIVWRFVPSQVIRASFGQAFRKPSFLNTSFHVVGVQGSELVPTFGDFIQHSIGNENLTNESITAFELGYRGQFFEKALVLEADVYLNFYKNAIEVQNNLVFNQFNMPDLDASNLSFVNSKLDYNALGGSISATWHYKKIIFVSVNYCYRYLWDDGKNGNTDTGGFDRSSDYPHHLANLSLQYLSGFGLKAGAAAYTRSGYSSVWVEDGSLMGNKTWVYAPPVFIVSGFVGWRFHLKDRFAEIGTRVFDIFDSRFRDGTKMIRYDGVNIGAQQMSRGIMLYFRMGS